jgi:hypothetical protein
MLKKTIWASFQRNILLFTKNLSTSSQNDGFGIWDPEKSYSGSRIRVQGSKKHRIPDPEHWYKHNTFPSTIFQETEDWSHENTVNMHYIRDMMNLTRICKENQSLLTEVSKLIYFVKSANRIILGSLRYRKSAI